MVDSAQSPVVLWLSSRYENIELAVAALEDFGRHAGMESDQEHWVGMALREALANAIKHGNKQDASKRVMVAFASAGSEMRIHVADEGAGFNPETITDPLAPENQLRPSGRGIFYIRTFMDDVSFDRTDTGGTILVMKKSFKSRKPGIEKGLGS